MFFLHLLSQLYVLRNISLLIHSQTSFFYKFLMILLSVTKGLTLSTLTLHRCTWARIGTNCTCCSCSPLARASTSRPLPVRLPLSPFPGPHPRYTADSRFRGFPAQKICQENTTFSDFCKGCGHS